MRLNAYLRPVRRPLPWWLSSNSCLKAGGFIYRLKEVPDPFGSLHYFIYPPLILASGRHMAQMNFV
jgi:hypothetical protein